MNILAVVNDKYTACEEYRVTQPLQELEKRGHKCLIMKDSGMMKLISKNVNPFIGIDLLLFNRMVLETSAEYNSFVLAARQRGIAVVVDYDDDYTQTYRIVHDKKLPDLRNASALTFSTGFLRDTMKGYNKHCYVIPNCLQMERFDGHKRGIPYPVVGFSGSTTHSVDWRPAAIGLAEARKEKDFTILCSGLLPKELEDLMVLTPRDLDPKYSLTVPYQDYPWLVSQYDILIGAVDPDDLFNHSKSNLKFLEASAAMVYFIGTGGRLPIYQEARGLGTLVDDHSNPEAWKRAVIDALDHRADCSVAVARAASFVQDNYAAPLIAKKREQIYELIVDRERRRNDRQSSQRN